MTSISPPDMDLGLVIRSRLSSFRQRILLLGASSAAGWGFSVALAILILAAWLDLSLDFPGPIRALLGYAAFFSGTGLAGNLLFRAIHATNARAMAKTLDAAAGANGQIVSGLDLAQLSPHASSPLTAGLARIATRQAIQLAGAVPSSVAAPVKPLIRPITILSSIILFLLIASAVSPRLWSTQWQRFTDPYGDHPPYSAIQFTVDPGNVKAIYGSAADVRAVVSGGAVDTMELVYTIPSEADQIVPMFPEGEGKWRATLADLVSPGKYFIRAGKARSAQFDVAIVTVPQIQKVTFRVTLPAYTHRAPYEGPLPQSGLAGLPGTRVMVRAGSNRPLSGGKITLTATTTQPSNSSGESPAQTVDMFPTSPGASEAIGFFDIHEPGKFQFSIKDTDGQSSTDVFSGSISLLTDEKPFVRIIEPRETSFATPDAVMKVLAVAEDDYGISKLQIYRGLNDSHPRPMDIPVPDGQPTQFPAQMILKLGDYGLSPGDEIKIFARVEDNDPAGAKGGESPVTTIHIVSQKDMDQMQMTRDAMEVLQSKYAQAARRLEALSAEADKLEKELAKDDPKGALTPEEQKKVDDLAKDLDTAAAELGKLANHDLPIDLDQALKQQLADMAANLKQDAQLAKDAGKSGIDAAGAMDKIQQIQQQLGGNQNQFQKDALDPLEHLAEIYPLIQDQARFVDLYNRQKDLADRMSPLETTHGLDDPQLKVRMRDLQDEQQQLRDDLRTLLDDIDNHANALPADPKLDDLKKSAQDFSQAVRDSQADAQMQDGTSALQDFAGTRALTSAHGAADTLNQFIARGAGVGQKGEQALKFQPALANGLGNTVQQLLGQAGLGNMGMGQSGGGYSAARSSLQNVGLYGTLPLISQQSSGGGGKADRGSASHPEGAPDGQNNPDANADQRHAHASGAGDAPVPPQYKARVGEYFQRVDDELSIK